MASCRARAQPPRTRHALYEHSTRVLADLDEAERCAAAGALPRGRVSVNSSVSFGHLVLVPLLPTFLAAHPEMTLDLSLTDRVIDLMDERADIAIRWGPLPPSELVARLLGETAQVIVAAPACLERYGTPRTPAELEAHNCLGTNYRRSLSGWPLRVEERLVDMPVAGNVRASDGETLRQLALQGVGLVRLSHYHVGKDLAAGTLLPVMEEFNPNELAPIHAVYLGKPGRLPSRVQAVLDFMVANVRVEGSQQTMRPSKSKSRASGDSAKHLRTLLAS